MSEPSGLWTPPQGHIIRQTIHVGPPSGYAVRWAHADETPDSNVLWVDFAIYEVIGSNSDGTIWYRTPNWVDAADNTTNIDEATPLITGFVKWDGCTQWSMDDEAHVDGKAGLEEWFEALRLARKVALTEMITSPLDDEY